jgi:hypothetical protein
LQKTLRAYTRPFRKNPLEMEGTEVHFLGYLIQFGLALKISLQVLNCLLNTLVVDMVFFCCQYHKTIIFYDVKLAPGQRLLNLFLAHLVSIDRPFV